jgi:hypothetical protein
MLRSLILFMLLAGAVLFALPFFVSSMYVDERGITIPGRVFSKREDVTVQHSTWTRSCEMTIQYFPPDTGSTAFLGVSLSPEGYDEFRKGQAVNLHYLQKKDVPDLPMAKILSQVHALTTARLVGQKTFSNSELVWRNNASLFSLVGGMVVVLFIWRLARQPGFGWAVCFCVLGAVVVMLISEFPKPQPAPVAAVRRGSGKVKTLDRIDRVFEGTRSRGIEVHQPVSVVGVEFVPDERMEPVLAVDLIDAGSLPGLREGSPVAIDYEAASPRTAHIQNATRTFVGRNIRGMAVDGVLCVLLLIGMLAAAQFIGRGYNKLAGRTK